MVHRAQWIRWVSDLGCRERRWACRGRIFQFFREGPWRIHALPFYLWLEVITPALITDEDLFQEIRVSLYRHGYYCVLTYRVHFAIRWATSESRPLSVNPNCHVKLYIRSLGCFPQPLPTYELWYGDNFSPGRLPW